jgi:hypothetical protein
LGSRHKDAASQTVRFYVKWPKPAAKPARQPNKESEPADAVKPVIATVHTVTSRPSSDRRLQTQKPRERLAR